MSGIRIGTSGWHYASWRGPFYPPGTGPKGFLSFYTQRFTSVEINNSFYRLPTERAVRSWAGAAPEGFLFAWKASRFITHFKRLKDVGESIELVFGRMEHLGDSQGPVLFQLPPQQKADRERLAAFLDLLPRHPPAAVEFRHPSWYEAPILDVLRDNDVSLCISDHAHAPAPREVTAKHVYVRPHGPGGQYKDNYPHEALAHWAKDMARWREEGRTVFCYFDNDQKSAAPKDAQRLQAKVDALMRAGPARPA